MDAGIYYEANRTPHFVAERAKFDVGIAVQPQLITQRFRIKRPTFDISRVSAITAKLRQVSEFIGDTKLEDVPRNSFVQNQRREVVERARLRLVGVYVKVSWTRAVGCGGLSVGRGHLWRHR